MFIRAIKEELKLIHAENLETKLVHHLLIQQLELSLKAQDASIISGSNAKVAGTAEMVLVLKKLYYLDLAETVREANA